MSRSVAVLVLLMLLAFGTTAPAGAESDVRVNGHPTSEGCLPVEGSHDHPGPGDVVLLGDVGIRLDGTFPPDFRTVNEGYSLTKYFVGDPPRLVALSIKSGEAAKAFLALSDEEVRGLRGIYLEATFPEIETALARIDPAWCCVSLRFTDRFTEMPSLPETLECLRLHERGPRDVDLTGLAKLKSLRVLDARWAPDTLALKSLAGLTKLRCLTVDLADGKDPTPLEALVGLRHLDVSGRGTLPAYLASQAGRREEIRDISFVSTLKALRCLVIRDTGVESLAPLSDHPSLEEIRAGSTRVTELPGGRLPSLRCLDVLGAEIAADAVAAFRARNPDCAIRWSLDALLRERVEGATRLRVRSGGTCHREEAREKTIFETSDAEEIAALLEAIEVNLYATRETAACSCCGQPTVEFYDEGGLLAMVGVHHGVALRWSGWPSDVVLTLDSIGRLCGWLEARDIPGPGEEATRLIGNHGALQRRLERCRELLPAGVWERLDAPPAKARAALEKAVSDPIERALLCFRLLGCEDGSWNRIVGLDRLLLEELVPSFPGEVLGKAIRRAAEPRELNGAGRVVLGGGAHAEIPREDLEAALPAVARHALAHPRLVNRRRSMAVLARLDLAAATAALTAALEKRVPLRTLAAPEALEPEEMLEFLPLDAELDMEGTDRAFAARMLAKMGHREAADAIEAALADAVDEPEREALRGALEALRAPR